MSAGLYTQQQIRERVVELDAMLADGVNSTSTDGTTTSVDLNAIRAERDRLKSMLETTRKQRPTTGGIRLTGF